MSLPPRVDAAYVDRLTSLVAASGQEVAGAVAPWTGESLPAIPQSSPA